jgi:Polysaccharide lyase
MDWPSRLKGLRGLRRHLVGAACLTALVVGWTSCGSRAQLPNLGHVIWGGTLSAGNLGHAAYVQACHGPNPPRGAAVVEEPLHPGFTRSLRFTVADSSVHNNCPILGSPGNPNANVLSPPLFRPGDDTYVGFSVFFPRHFPSICDPLVRGCFFQLMEIYGRPFAGLAPVTLMVFHRHLFLSTRAAGQIWKAPHDIPYGTRWSDFVLHVHFATSPNAGFVELWYDGRRQRFLSGSTRFHEATLALGVNWDGVHPDQLYQQQYRGANPRMGTLTVYQTEARIGTSYRAAAPMGCARHRRWVCPNRP